MTDQSKLVNTAKYAGTSITLGTALGTLVVFMLPHLKDVESAIVALLIFSVNIILVKSGIISD